MAAQVVEGLTFPQEPETTQLGSRELWAACRMLPPTWGQVVHVHARLEVGIVLAGLHEIHYPQHVVRCRAGEVWFCAPWEPHGVQTAAPGTHIVVLRFHPQFLGEQTIGALPWTALFLGGPAERPRAATEETRGSALASARLMCREISERRACWEEAVRFELLRLLVDLARDWQAPEVGVRALPTVGAESLARLMPALALVHSARPQIIHAAEAAHACGLSVPGFHRCFRRVTGLTFGQFRQRARLSQAASLLVSTSRTVASIAVESGFVDDSHLRRCFSAEYQCTPAAYRKRFRAAVPAP
jgi:AraC-like DNA-binding protein